MQLEISQRNYMDEDSFEYDDAKAERLQRVLLLLALRLARAIAVRQVLFVRRVVVDHRCL